MTTGHKDFEVISNSDSNEEEQSEIKIQETKVNEKDDCYSQDNRAFMFELYRENRALLDKISEKDKQIAKLEEKSVYLANSNVFWLCCYIGSTAIGFLSLVHN